SFERKSAMPDFDNAGRTSSCDPATGMRPRWTIIRRAGCAFVPSTGEPSPSGYCLPAELRPTRVPYSAQAALCHRRKGHARGAANDFSRSLRTFAEQDLPALDARDPQHVHRHPRIGREPRLDLLLPLGVHDVHEPRAIAERAAQHDEALLGEAVHERGVVVPALLLAHSARGVPRRPGHARDHEVGHSTSAMTIASTYSPARR